MHNFVLTETDPYRGSKSDKICMEVGRACRLHLETRQAKAKRKDDIQYMIINKMRKRTQKNVERCILLKRTHAQPSFFQYIHIDIYRYKDI